MVCNEKKYLLKYMYVQFVDRIHNMTFHQMNQTSRCKSLGSDLRGGLNVPMAMYDGWTMADRLYVPFTLYIRRGFEFIVLRDDVAGQ